MTTLELHYPEFKVVKEETRKPGETKNFVICFDGTCASPIDAVQDAEKPPPNLFDNATGLSNIGKIHLLAGGTIDNSSCVIDGQVSLYYHGVGTWGEKGVKQMARALQGFGIMTKIYMDAYENLKKMYQEGDKVYIFGFSRGAATARLFASYLSKDANKISGITPAIALLGVFDTVVMSSDIGRNEDIKNLDVESEEKKRKSSLPENVARAVHLVSIDDHREPFKPTLFNEDDRVTEVWCTGVHSDVGGGYYHDGLSDTYLMAMMKEAELAGMKARKITVETPKETILGENNVDDKVTKCFAVFDKDMDIKPNALEPDIHDECTIPYRVGNRIMGFTGRDVRRMKDDKTYKGEPVLIFDSAVERFENYEETVPYFSQNPPYIRSGWFLSAKTIYRPENLIGVDHKIVTVGEKGFEVVEGKTLPSKY